MKKRTIAIYLLMHLALLLLQSCVKDSTQLKKEPNDKIRAFDNWKSNTQASSTQRKERLNELALTAKFDEASELTNEDGEMVVVIPLSSKFKSGIPRLKDYTTNFLVLTQNFGTNTYRANILLYKPLVAGKTATTKAIVNAIDAISENEDGIYALTTAFDKFLFERKYISGRLIEFSEIEASTKSTQTQNRDGEVCTDWWLVTTTYYSDGYVEVSSEFLYTVCSSCQPNELCDELEGGGGGGGNPIEEEYAIAREIGWSIKRIDLYYYVWSTERLKGKRNSSEPQGGHFTGIVHLGSGLNKPNWIWNNDYRQASASGQTASAHMKGHVYGPNGEHYFADKTETWSFSSVF